MQNTGVDPSLTCSPPFKKKPCSLEDTPGLPCFSYATGHASPASVVAVLRGRGFTVARSAYDGDASKLGSSRRVRTDSPAAVFSEVLEHVAGTQS